MIPKNLEECLKELHKKAHDKDLEEIKSRPEDDMIEFHHTLGRWMRNEWGLWKGGPLLDYFKGLGLWHADDCSGLILTSFYRHLKGLPLDIEGQVAEYKEYWAKQGIKDPNENY